MAWRFERVAGPFEGPAAGLAWDGTGMLFSILSRGPRAGEGRILRFDPRLGETSVFRAFTNRTSGIAFGADRALYGCQELSRRIVRFNPDGSASLLATLVDGRMHNLPTALALDSRGRIWFCDSKSPLRTSGPLIYPQGDLESVLLLSRRPREETLRRPREETLRRPRESGDPIALNEETGSPPSRGRLSVSSENGWHLRRLTSTLDAPRAIALSPDERTLYLADRQGLHAFTIRDDTLESPRRLSERLLTGLNLSLIHI